MRIDILTTFPRIIESVTAESVLGRALARGVIDVQAVNLRDFAPDRHRTTDDEPFGGGPGMVMKCQPVFDAVDSLTSRAAGRRPKVILMTPQGRRFDQSIAEELAAETHLVLICGRYEGVDERIRRHLADDEISIGDYVITGGELAAMVVTEAVARLIPGVLGDETSADSESFSSGLLEYAQYTRPAEYRGYAVPETLLSGNHEEIRRWRRASALERTQERRPDLLESAQLTDEDRRFLRETRTEPAPEEDRKCK